MSHTQYGVLHVQKDTICIYKAKIKSPKKNSLPTYPNFLGNVTGSKHFFLGLTGLTDSSSVAMAGLSLTVLGQCFCFKKAVAQ